LVVLKPGGRAEAAELIALVREHKGPIYAPKSVEFIAALPMTPVGKADKKVLRARYWAGRERRCQQQNLSCSGETLCWAGQQH